MISVEITKNQNENPISIIRRFSRKVRASNILQKARKKRFYIRKDSKFKLKAHALNALEKRAHYALLDKLGKLPDNNKRGHNRRG